jgi:DNA segregation ATPase FtsK/SpoIIIE, S-DNA-T family
MASYQSRQREPLLDQNVSAMLERRGRELLGLGLVIAGLIFVMMLGSYSPEDPGWMVATDEAAQNMMGRFGAAVASTLIIIGGKGAWLIPAILIAWGVRFVLHRGAERALGRIVFAVIAVALASVYAATLVPGADWAHSFGLGGLFGDTILGALLNLAPVQTGIGLKLMSLIVGVALLCMALFVTGFNLQELRAIRRFLWVGLIVTYSKTMEAMGTGAARTAQALQDRRENRRAMAEAAQGDARISGDVPGSRKSADWGKPTALRADPRYADVPPAPREKTGLLARMPGLMRRVVADPEPELLEPALSAYALHAGQPSEDRIRSRISDVIRARGQTDAPAPLRREPPVVRAATAPQVAAIAGHLAKPQVWQDDAVDDEWGDDAAVDAHLSSYVQDTAMSPDRRAMVQHGAKKTQPSRQAVAEAQPSLRFDDPAPAYDLPPLNLLSAPSTVVRHTLSDEALEENARMLESVLDDYGVKGEITSVRPGPVVTMYELEPAPGLKASRVIGLADDIARSMSALSARVSTVPGRTVIGIELPNATREKVVLREIISARDFGDSTMRLPLALGKDIGGEPIVANLAKMPHLLIAGTTGSGKSVAINTMILSLLYKLTPEECRLIMIDPKMLELSVYDGIPHLLSPVVTDPKKAVVALKWVVGEMEDRYRRMSKLGVRNIEGYNGRVREALAKEEMFKRTIQTGFDEDTGEPIFETDEYQPVTIPYIVVVVDEMADLMMVAGKEIEACIQRLAQMARASGIHLIMATQRPSVDVITGTIKANFPTRISFQVTSKIDSRTILGEQGAEQLLGMGDMLYMAGGAKITRIHGPFVSDEEVEEIVNHLKSYGPPVYMSGVVEAVDEDAGEIDSLLGLGSDGLDDSLYDQAVAIVARDRKCSTSYIQRKLGIGYNKAAKLVEQMEEHSVITPANHVGKREILLPEH